MRLLLMLLICFVSFGAFSQEEDKNIEEFIPIDIEGKEAFMSTKTGEYVFRSHEKTNPEALVTTASGVVYTDVSLHAVKKGESLYSIAKKHEQSVDELKKNNNLKSSNLDIGQKLKIVKKLMVNSSSPVISYAGEERIIAKLRPGQSPTNLNPPSEITKVEVTSKEKNVESITKEVVSKDESSKDAEVLAEINVQNEAKSLHVVKKGESLFSIAKKHNLTVQKLKELNNLVLNNLSIGQRLKLQ